ncbi:unnamed protein product [Sphenostylis stenocarpa]|uniref:argininosuccinate synthase n=1 Tax=Sphenostylis stenocarpa TaxID=92480 RepID=A0AA86S6E7_9FABA|nr:unnamed protein product [Sphenostylis stenocarpa]
MQNILSVLYCKNLLDVLLIYGYALSTGDILEDPVNEPKKDMYIMSVDPEDAPDQRLSQASLLAELNEIGGRHGIGRIHMVHNRLVGMKNPGRTIC